MSTEQNYYVCKIDKHLKRKCEWKKIPNLYYENKYST